MKFTHWECGSVIDVKDVTALEFKLGVRLPKSYIEAVMKNDGGRPNVCCVSVFNPHAQRKELSDVGLIRIVGFEADHLTVELAQIADDHVHGTVEFAIDGGGYPFAFDYRFDPKTDNPPVVLINRDNPPEHSVLWVADSFDSFLDKLIDDDLADGGETSSLS